MLWVPVNYLLHTELPMEQSGCDRGIANHVSSLASRVQLSTFANLFRIDILSTNAFHIVPVGVSVRFDTSSPISHWAIFAHIK